MNEIHEKIKKLVERELSCAAHSMDHVMRVYNLCIHLSLFEEGVDMDILVPAALLHDIARVKEDTDETRTIDHAVLGAQMAGVILEGFGYDIDSVNKIKRCIVSHRFRGGEEPDTIEARILFDADKIDAMGAVGLARSYMIAGQYGQKLYADTGLYKYMEENIAENERVRDIQKHAPNIEYEMKFKKIPGMLYTAKGREIANERLSFMEQFFKRLESEINGRG